MLIRTRPLACCVIVTLLCARALHAEERDARDATHAAVVNDGSVRGSSPRVALGHGPEDDKGFVILAPDIVESPELHFVHPPQEHAFGNVTMEVDIDARGEVTRVFVLDAPDLYLAHAALGAMTNARFRAARRQARDGRETAIAVRIVYVLIIHGEHDDEGAKEHLHPDEAPVVVGEPYGPSVDAESSAVDVQTLSVHGRPIEETRVTAKKVARAERDSTQSIGVLEGDEISRMRGRSLAGMIAELPGATLIQSGPGLEKPVVRGAFGRRLVMLVDGVRHEGQDWGIDHAPELDASSAGRITVVKGPSAVRYGADAIGGVILIDPPPLRSTPGISSDVSIGAVDNGLLGTGSARVDVVPAQIPDWTTRLEASATKGAARHTPDYVLGNTASEVAQVAAISEVRSLFVDGLDFKLSYARYQARLGICYCLNVSTPEELAARAALRQPVTASNWTVSYDLDRPRQELVHDLAVARVTVDLARFGDVVASVSSQRDMRDEFDQVRSSVTRPQFSFLLLTTALDVVYRHGALQVSPFNLVGETGVRTDFQEHTYQGLQLIPNFRRATAGAFVVERARITNVLGIADVELLSGARVDGLAQRAYLSDRVYRAQQRRERMPADTCVLEGDVARCDKNLLAWSATAGARMLVDVGRWRDAWVIQADVSRASRFPDVDELYLGGRAPSLPVLGLGHAGLGAEESLQWSVDMALRTPRLTFDVGVFASRSENYIAFGPERNDAGAPIIDVLVTGAYPRFGSSAVNASIAGVDGLLRIRPIDALAVSLDAAFVRGVDLTRGTSLPFMPPPQARARAQVFARPLVTLPAPLVDVDMELETQVVARQLMTSRHTDFVAPPPGYVLWNMRAHAALALFETPVDLDFEVRNALDRRYRDPMSLMRYYADQPGREVWLRTRVMFGHVFADAPSTREREAPLRSDES